MHVPRCRLLAAWMLLLAAGFGPSACAQGWAFTLGSDARDVATDVRRTSDGGFVVVGTTDGFGLSWGGNWVLKLDAAGSIEWQKAFDAGPGQSCNVVQAADGGFLVVGTVYIPPIRGPTSPWLMKLDAAGGIEWQRLFELGRDADASAVASMPDGSFVVAGKCSFLAPRGAWILHVDAMGGALRLDEYRNVDDRVGVTIDSLLPMSGGGLLISGIAAPGIFLMQVDPAGAIVSQATFAVPCMGIYPQEARLAPTADGGWLLAVTAGTCGVTLSKLDASLGATWSAWLQPTGDRSYAALPAVTQVADGGYVIVGSGPSNALAVKLDAGGGVEWQHAFGPRAATLSAVAATPDSGALGVGCSVGDMYLQRVDAAGRIDSTCGEIADASFTVEPLAITWTDPGLRFVGGAASVQPTSAMAIVTDALPVGIGDVYESSDSCDTPTRLVELETTAHDFCDDPEDWFELVACAGVSYTLATTGLAPLANTVIEILAPDCSSVLAADDDGGGGLASRLDWIAPADGRFRVRVRQADGTAGSDRAYEMTLLRNGPGCGTWLRLYPPRESSRFADVASLADGSFVVVGQEGLATTTPVLLRLDPSGGAGGRDLLVGPVAASLEDIEAAGTGFIAAGSLADASGNDGGYLIAFDASGAISWQKRYVHDIFIGGFTHVRRLRDGGFLAVGTVDAGTWVMRTDAAGNVTWSHVLDHLGPDSAGDAVELGDGSLMISAYASAEPGALLIRMDAAGVVQWQRVYQQGAQAAVALAEAADGDIFASGGQSVMKLDPAGGIRWLVSAGAWDHLDEVLATPDGGCLVAGSESGWFSVYALMARLDASGNTQWISHIDDNSEGTTELRGLSATSDSGFVVVGGAYDERELVMRLDSNGALRDTCEQWNGRGFEAGPAPTWIDIAGTHLGSGVTVTAPALALSAQPVGYEEVCAGSTVKAEASCVDGTDEDGDGPIDCDDPDCDGNPACAEADRCDDGRDNDRDGRIDCDDPDCDGNPACAEADRCDDGRDNDRDGRIDCDDDDCLGDAACVDGDGDGRPDVRDCLPLDGAAFDVPPELPRIDVAKPPGSTDAEIRWSSLSAQSGSGTTYAVASESLSNLVATRSAHGACIAQGLATLSHRDARPTVGGGFWYLVRGENACGPPVGERWGVDSLGAERPGCP